MTLTLRPARRSEAKPLIGLYSESGCGKTKSALLLARGFVGPTGRIAMIETESGRGEVYVGDPEIGEYEVISLREDFSPKLYGEAITLAERSKVDALIIDSSSHEWEGVGGVLDMAARNQAQGRKGPIVWQEPKISHQRNFMLRFMQTPIPLVIMCMRAKYPMREVKKPDGSKDWQRSEILEPKQADDILFEMFVHGWIDHDHRLHVTKYTRDDLRPVIVDGEPVSTATGVRLGEWARSGGRPTANASVTKPPSFDDAEAAARKGTAALQSWWKTNKALQKELAPHLNDLKAIAAANEPQATDDKPAAGSLQNVSDDILAGFDDLISDLEQCAGQHDIDVLVSRQKQFIDALPDALARRWQQKVDAKIAGRAA